MEIRFAVSPSVHHLSAVQATTQMLFTAITSLKSSLSDLRTNRKPLQEAGIDILQKNFPAQNLP
jgi:hypothetical protein